MTKINIQLKIDEQDHIVLKEIAEEKRLPISTLIRTMIVENSEFKKISEEFTKIEQDNIEQEQKFKNLEKIC